MPYTNHRQNVNIMVDYYFLKGDFTIEIKIFF